VKDATDVDRCFMDYLQSKKRKYTVKDATDVDRCFMDYLQSKKRKSSENADEQFLLSLLPDISKMNMLQKRIFKKRVLDEIDSVFDEEEP
jgi:hypothetical protein